MYRKYFPDEKEVRREQIGVRVVALIYLAVLVWFYIWAVAHANLASPIAAIFSTIFLAATTLVALYGVLTVINHWHYTVPELRKLPQGRESMVAILIPTYAEPHDIVLRTLASVVSQDWPRHRRAIFIGDDARSDDLQVRIERFKREHGEPNIFYHRPPRHGHPERMGDAKAGNLNALLALAKKLFPDLAFVETRDADDMVGTSKFLRCTIQFLNEHPDYSFVQTIKRCKVHPGDPFSNLESHFYTRNIPSRMAANAVFPCGSGLVWRADEIDRIGGFPHWNLVEDVQSGFEILRLGGRGGYLPIVGAYGQIAPEDIPNFYKQRGTWAIDTLRLFFWRNPFLVSGLTLRQRLQFFELEFSYLLSFTIAMFVVSIVANLAFGIYQLTGTSIEFAWHSLALAVAFELYHVARARGIPYRELWQSRKIWIGLMPVFIAATWKALSHGPHKKPAYRVTRKYHEHAWYWRETLIQAGIVLVLLGAIAADLFLRAANMRAGHVAADFIVIFWACYFIIAFSQMIENSWHGLSFNELRNQFPIFRNDAMAREVAAGFKKF